MVLIIAPLLKQHDDASTVSGCLPVGQDHIRVALQRVEVVFGKSITGLGGGEQEAHV